MTLFRDLSGLMKWFATEMIFNINIQKDTNWFVARNIPDDKVLMNHAKISSTRIKVQFTVFLS